LAGRIPKSQLAAIREVHTESGQHQVEETQFPYWVPEEMMKQAEKLTEKQAVEAVGRLLPVMPGWS
jgi:hypothetical protein